MPNPITITPIRVNDHESALECRELSAFPYTRSHPTVAQHAISTHMPMMAWPVRLTGGDSLTIHATGIQRRAPADCTTRRTGNIGGGASRSPPLLLLQKTCPMLGATHGLRASGAMASLQHLGRKLIAKAVDGPGETSCGLRRVPGNYLVHGQLPLLIARL